MVISIEELYSRRVERLKKLEEMKAPQILIDNEKRLIKEAEEMMAKKGRHIS